MNTTILRPWQIGWVLAALWVIAVQKPRLQNREPARHTPPQKEASNAKI